MSKLYTALPEGYGECPVCNGTGHMPCPDAQTRLYGVQSGWYGYRAADDTVRCTNCGAQTMSSRPIGYTKLNKAGAPCRHSYVGRNAGRCYTKYTCTDCGDEYAIDSGD